MRNLVSMLVATLVAQFTYSTAGLASDGNVTFRIKNGWNYSLQFQIYSRDTNYPERRGHRRWIWPTPSTAWTVKPGATIEQKISCHTGEKVCFGAHPEGYNAPHWGVGVNGDSGCVDCCLTCKGGQSGWNLISNISKPYHVPTQSQSAGNSSSNGVAQILGVLGGIAGAAAVKQRSYSAPAPRAAPTPQGVTRRQSGITGGR